MTFCADAACRISQMAGNAAYLGNRRRLQSVPLKLLGSFTRCGTIMRELTLRQRQILLLFVIRPSFRNYRNNCDAVVHWSEADRRRRQGRPATQLCPCPRRHLSYTARHWLQRAPALAVACRCYAFFTLPVPLLVPFASPRRRLGHHEGL